jgi:alkanesulfonate monooxygenase SsuD/methylene tetrahydromethanopterin reductase-like flavin-dependent oxidoreductase (luciferase family)
MTDSAQKLRIGLYTGRDELFNEGPRDEAREKIKIADQLGYDSLWFDDAGSVDVVTVLGEVVRATERITIGTAIMNIFTRSPTLIAETFATLDLLSGGRMVIGLGAASAEYLKRRYGVPFIKPLRRLREYVEIINLLMRGERLDYHGDLFELDSPGGLSFTPARNHIPIYIGAMWSKSVEQTGEIADGILTGGAMTTDEYDSVRTQLAVGAARAGRSADEITCAVPIVTAYVIDESQRESQRQQFLQQRKWGLARMIVGTWATKERRQRLAQDFPEQVKAVEDAWTTEADPMKAMAACESVTDEMVDSRMIGGHECVGTAKEIHKALVELKSLGVDLPIVVMPSGSPDDVGRILEEVING